MEFSRQEYWSGLHFLLHNTHKNYEILPELHCENLKLDVRWWFNQSSLFAAQVSHCPPAFLPLPSNTLKSFLLKCDLTWYIGLYERKHLPRCSFAGLIILEGWFLYEVWSCGDYTADITWNSKNLGKTNFLVHSLALRVLLFQKQDTSFQVTRGLIPKGPKAGATEQLWKVPLNICSSS